MALAIINRTRRQKNTTLSSNFPPPSFRSPFPLPFPARRSEETGSAKMGGEMKEKRRGKEEQQGKRRHKSPRYEYEILISPDC